ncbi:MULTISPECIES: hypothetical protein [Cyanophyceae]|uniref:hypothetical protein n=1 Tax=Cyanophyceae TaxID=3028117 RepID=UPI002330E85D|nr:MULTISPECIES: hypothetical protein [Cyanophyceae]MDB9357076.1 hypothetical protein [Nodularia spumigena CS-587/03]MDB9303143.1 hypothetical protein [Nodularia spumigena CS-591/12]MDB9319939.1 hypothetical protein [Nodularia spumigena CS-590/01A]MDB9321902.1 hypothetical protein [Nodularia spumigena CS-591/07A]MDB9325455.1 hypothetical protein [Nodularia spumigena CS-590/02]
MTIVKTLPWISLVLVLFSYGTLGWALSETQAPLYVWITFILAVSLLVASLTIPWSAISKYSNLFLQSNIRSFAVATFGAFLFFLMLAWFRIFLDTLLIISAGILARIDFQTAGYKQGQAFLITLTFSLAGLALGKVLHLGFSQQL